MAQMIAAFVADLMFQMRIESVAEDFGITVKWLENVDQVKLTEIKGFATFGINGMLIEQVTRIGARTIVFDLGNKAIPWSAWIPVLKKNPATKRIPIICFGSHVDVNTLKHARRVGSDEVMARSRFVTSLPQLIQKYLLSENLELLSKSCEESPHPDAIIGLELFNQGDYFEAHEYLEKAWMDDPSPGRDLYRGILQVAVAYFQIHEGNYRGTVKMFQRARYWLEDLPCICRGIHISQLLENAFAVYDLVLILGPERINQFPLDSLKPVEWELN